MNIPGKNQFNFEQNRLLQQVHFSDYLSVLKKRKWIIIFSFMIIVGLVALYSFLVTPLYQATAQILIEVPSSPMTGVGEVDIKGKQAREDYFQLVYQLLISREVAETVAVRANERFGVSEQILQEYAAWSANPTTPLPDNFPFIYTAEQLLAGLRISPVTGFGLINISVYDPSPETASWLANLHAEVFIKERHKKNKEQIKEKFEWLTQQIKIQKEKVKNSYQELYNYQKKYGLISVGKNNDIVEQKLTALNSALINAKAEREAKETVYEELQKLSDQGRSLFSVPVISQDKIIMDLRNQQIRLQEQKAEMTAEYGEKHSKMIELQKKLNHLSRQFANELKRIVLLSKEEADRAVFLESIARNALEEQKKVAVDLQEKVIRYDMLQREADSNQAIYDTLLAEGKKVNLSSMFDGDKIHLTERARVPRGPAKPKTILNILLAIILSLFIGSGLAFFVEYMDRIVRTSEDVVQHLGLPVFGVLPYEKNHCQKNILASADLIGGVNPKNSYSYPYLQVLDWLPAELQLGQPGGSGSVLLVGSAVTGEGKTTVLGKIAVRLGKAGFQVLAADCDFQRPALHKLFADNNPIGFTNALQDISAVEINSGYLNKCSVSDLYSLIKLRKMSGKLTITNEEQLTISLFQNGRLLNIESDGNIRQNRLGTMLLNGGFLSEKQLNEAIERNKRTGQPFGYILINSGYITQENLQGHLKLQTEENLQKLFSWKNGTYNFESKVVKMYENEKIYFEENYDPIIQRQSQMTGSLLFEKNINSLIRETEYKNVHFIAAGNTRSEQGDPINFRLLSKFINIFRNSYDLILLDGPPAIEATDSTAFAQMSDGVVFVVKSGHLSYTVLHQALDRLSAADTAILGAVLNQVKAKDLTI